MVLKRRWGIIGGIALAQIAIVVALQFTLSGGTMRVIAQAEEQQPEPVHFVQHVPRIGQVDLQHPAPAPLPKELDIAVMPPIPVPVMPTPPKADPGILPTVFAEAYPLTEVAQGPKGIDPIPPYAPSPQPPSNAGYSVPMQPPSQGPMDKKADPQLAVTCPWNLQVEVVKGRTYLTAQNGQELKFTISCDKLDLQTPAGFIVAIGNVKVATDSIEGDCERLTISWRDEVVVLQKAQLKCKLQGNEAAFQAELLTVRLSPVVAVPQVPTVPGNAPSKY